MPELKTRPTASSVAEFLDRLEPGERRRDCETLCTVMAHATGARPRMWGSSIIGFGDLRYQYASGRAGEWFLCGFSPRRHDLAVYVASGLHLHGDLLSRLGRHKAGKGCLHIKRLADVDLDILRQVIARSVGAAQGAAS